MQTADKVIGL